MCIKCGEEPCVQYWKEEIAELEAELALERKKVQVLAERCNELIEDPNPAQGAPVEEWIEWATVKAKD